jgi:hypothetical protein
MSKLVVMNGDYKLSETDQDAKRNTRVLPLAVDNLEAFVAQSTCSVYTSRL